VWGGATDGDTGDGYSEELFAGRLIVGAVV